jgi:hypothetical protein
MTTARGEAINLTIAAGVLALASVLVFVDFYFNTGREIGDGI